MADAAATSSDRPNESSDILQRVEPLEGNRQQNAAMEIDGPTESHQQQLPAILEQFNRQFEALQRQSAEDRQQLAAALHQLAAAQRQADEERQAAQRQSGEIQQQLATTLQQLAAAQRQGDEDRKERQAAQRQSEAAQRQSEAAQRQSDEIRQQLVTALQQLANERQAAQQRLDKPVSDFKWWIREAKKYLLSGPVQKDRNGSIAIALEETISNLGLDVSIWKPDDFVRRLLEQPESLTRWVGDGILELAYLPEIPERKIFFVKNPKNPAPDDYKLNRITLIEAELSHGAICNELLNPPHGIVTFFIQAMSQKVPIQGEDIHQLRKAMEVCGLDFDLYLSSSQNVANQSSETHSVPASSFMALFTESIQRRCDRLVNDSHLKEFALDTLLISDVVDEFIFTVEGYERNRAVSFPLSFAGNGSVTYIRPHPDISIRKTLYNDDVGLNIFLVELKHGKATTSEVTRDNTKLAFMAAQNLHIAGLCGVATPLSVIPCLQIVGLNATLYIAYVFEDDTKYCRVFSYDLGRPQHRFGLGLHLWNLRSTFSFNEARQDNKSTIEKLTSEYGDHSRSSTKTGSRSVPSFSDPSPPQERRAHGQVRGLGRQAVQNCLSEIGVSNACFDDSRTKNFPNVGFGQMGTREVCIKIVSGPSGHREKQYLELLDSEAARMDPRNRIIRLIGSVQLPRNDDYVDHLALLFPVVSPLSSPLTFSTETAHRLCSELQDAVEFLHERGLVHHDIKPDNLGLVTGPDGQQHLVVLDVGLMKEYAPGQMTSGRGRGTRAFLPPKVLRLDLPTDPFELDRYAMRKTADLITEMAVSDASAGRLLPPEGVSTD
ncbi:hypothetical protein HK405_001536 [Cladochytrium tenue]|nr:hypothetical protein HK405_001536 [Cladochytrium tenue]